MNALPKSLDDLELGIFSELEKIETIDCHEHLPPESARVGRRVDAITLFSHYCYHDMVSSGMSPEQMKTIFSAAPIEEKWRVFKPFYECIRYSCFARSAHIAMERFYGVSELRDDTVLPLTEAMNAANTPGLYERVLRRACNIKTVLTQNSDPTDTCGGLLTHVSDWIGKFENWSCVTDKYGRSLGNKGAVVNTLDDLISAVERHIDYMKNVGAVGIKLGAIPFKGSDRAAALEVFEYLKSHPGENISEHNALRDYVHDHMIGYTGRSGLVMCMHTGYWTDYRDLNPSHLIPLLDRHPETRFDVYHVGYPYMREAIMLGKARANVCLNMAWTYVISQKFAFDALDEIMEMVPINKVLSFGGDYYVIEKVYGHLQMARETISRVLAGKIRRGFMTTEQALSVAEKILNVNARELYGI